MKYEVIFLDDQVELVGRDSAGRFFDVRLERDQAVTFATDILYWDAGDYDRDIPAL